MLFFWGFLKSTVYYIYPSVTFRYKEGKSSSLDQAVFRNKAFSIIICSCIEIRGVGGQRCPWGGFASHRE